MALKLRLSRGGSKKRPYYRIVVAEHTRPRDGKFIEKIGSYNPLLPKDHSDRVKVDTERAKHWLSVGATPSDRVARFLGEAKIIPMPAKRNNPTRAIPKKIRRGEVEAAPAAAAAPAEKPADKPAEAAPVAEPKEEAPKEEVKAEAPAPAAAAEKPAEEAKAEAPKEEAKAEAAKEDVKEEPKAE